MSIEKTYGGYSSEINGTIIQRLIVDRIRDRTDGPLTLEGFSDEARDETARC